MGDYISQKTINLSKLVVRPFDESVPYYKSIYINVIIGDAIASTTHQEALDLQQHSFEKALIFKSSINSYTFL